VAVVGNFSQVQAALGRIPPRVDVADEIVEENAAQIVAQIAEQLAPKLTGKLSASVDDEGGLVVVTAPYGAYVEYGTRHTKAQPFLRPAAERAELIIRQSAEPIYTAASR